MLVSRRNIKMSYIQGAKYSQHTENNLWMLSYVEFNPDLNIPHVKIILIVEALFFMPSIYLLYKVFFIIFDII